MVANGHKDTRLHQRRKRTTFAGASLMVVLTLAATACSSGGGSTASPRSSATTQAGSSLAAIKASVQQHENPATVTFPKPTQAFTPGKHKIAILWSGLSAAGTTQNIAYMQRAVKALGWPAPTILDGQFSPATQANLMKQVARGGYDGIIMDSITPSDVTSGLQALIAAHVPTVCEECGGNLPPGIIGDEFSSQTVGKLQAEWVIAESNGSAKVAVFDDREFTVSHQQALANEEELRSACPGCTVITQGFTVAEAESATNPFFSAFLTAHPKGTIQYIILPYDSAAENFAKIAQQRGRTEIKFIALGPFAPYYESILSGNPPGAVASIATPAPYYYTAAVDLLARAIAKAPTWNATNMPVAIVTKQDASKFPGEVLNPPFNYLKMFESFWKS